MTALHVSSCQHHNGGLLIFWGCHSATAVYVILQTQADSDGNRALDTDQPISLGDLQAALNDFLAHKRAPTQAENPSPGSWQGIMQQPAFANAPAPPPAVTAAPQPATVTANPDVQALESDEVEDEQREEADLSSSGFGGLDMTFLKDMQSGLESLGYDLTSSDIMQQIVQDAGLPEALLLLLATMGGDVAILKEKIRQWQQAIQQQIEQEKELAKKGQRPVWRCAVCGRYGCPVAPYIESYQEV